jgi:uncharacterized cupin superfamily protein
MSNDSQPAHPGITPVRRVVTGTDGAGRSRVLFDGPAPNVNPGAIRPGTCMTDVWVYESCPAPISGEGDDGRLPFSFEPPNAGGHLRIVQSPGRPPGYDPAKDDTAVPLHEPRQRKGGTWDRGGASAISSPVHKSETVDYGILLHGERVLLLDDGEYVMRPGDVVVQLGNWHGWQNPGIGSLMAFVMMGAKFDPPGTRPVPLRPTPPPAGVRRVRRIVTIDDEYGKSIALCDAPAPDVLTDPARPGFSSTRIWVTDCTPAAIRAGVDTAQGPQRLEPPPGGSVCRVLSVPPDDGFRGKVDEKAVRAYFESAGSPGASLYSARARHPYMQKTATLDLCMVIAGEVTLVLDTAEVRLEAGDTVVQRGTSHAWSNHANEPCLLAISSHDARR